MEGVPPIAVPSVGGISTTVQLVGFDRDFIIKAREACLPDPHVPKVGPVPVVGSLGGFVDDLGIDPNLRLDVFGLTEGQEIDKIAVRDAGDPR